MQTDASPRGSETDSPYVTDTESTDDDRLLVLNQTTTPAAEVVVHEMPPGDDDRTVADYNDEFSPDAPVTFAAYVSALDDRLGEWSVRGVREMFEDGELETAGVKPYAFPTPRLNSQPE